MEKAIVMRYVDKTGAVFKREVPGPRLASALASQGWERTDELPEPKPRRRKRKERTYYTPNFQGW